MPDGAVPSTPFRDAVDSVIAGFNHSRAAAKALYRQLTLEEKLGLLDADHSAEEVFNQLRKERYNITPYLAGVVDRVGLPGIRFSDGPRGCSLGQATAFPAPITRAAAWDVELEEEIGQAIAKEIRAQGGNTFGGVCVNVARHPAWGRAQEAYGEDPLLLGSMGAALSRGASSELMTIVKHFVLNSMEDMRFEVDVSCDEQTLHECYLPHFKQVLDEGRAASIMSCYNTVNGIQGGDHPQLNGIIRDIWNREDVFVMSDFLWGLRSGPASVKAGMDIEMMIRSVRWRSLPKALEEGTITEEDIERLGVRLIAAQIDYYARMARARKTTPIARAVVGCDEHLNLSRRAAELGMVLLKNRDEFLPLSGAPGAIKRIAVIGQIANARQTGDAGSSAVFTPEIVTPLEGLQAYGRAHGIDIVYNDGSNPAAALTVARSCDKVIIVTGMTRVEEGESMFNTNPAINSICFPGIFGSFLVTRLMQLARPILNNAGGDRDNLQLRPVDSALVHALAAPTEIASKSVLIVSAGSTVCLPDHVVKAMSAVMFTGYGGCRFGEALANVLFGVDGVEPTGRLPYVIPRDEINDLPVWSRWAKKMVYDRWWGYRMINRDHKQPAFAFGFGLGYGRWEMVPESLEVGDTRGRFFGVSVKIRNTGGRATTAIVQVYGGKDEASRGSDDYANVLLGFSKVRLAVDEVTTVSVKCRWNPVAHWDVQGKQWRVDVGTYILRVGQHEGDQASLSQAVEVVAPVEWSAA